MIYFVCACCRAESSGEISFLQHLTGKKHLAKSNGKVFVGLDQNRWGVRPELSDYFFKQVKDMEVQIAASGGKSWKGSGPAAPSVQKMGISRESIDLLHEALSASTGLAQAPEAEKRRLPTAPLSAAWAMGNARGSAGRPTPKAMEDDRADSSERSRGARPERNASVPPRPWGNRNLQAVRESLPVFEYRSKILKAVNSNQVIIVEGETGCGKTTQVAQYILEEAAEKEEPCMVICTQPRRISAISVSERVADERGEHLGGAVGYAVRMESKASAATCLLFCTTGVLLRRLENDAELAGATHIVVDEVHERGVESDFLLLALRNLCQRRKDLHVVLMSATMDKDLFGRYFGGAPGLTVPGRTFPVKTFYLEDALQVTRHVMDPTAEWCIGGGKGKGKGKGKDSGDANDLDAAKREDLSQAAVRQRYGKYGDRVQAALSRVEQDEVNYDLLVQLLEGDTLQKLDDEAPSDDTPARPSGVLVFLSGAKEIEKVQEALLQSREFRSEPARSWVLPLHGSLPSEDQKKVFNRPPPGVRKIILSTNVAETSVTIDDVGYVVDTSRMKEMRYDASKRMSSLEDTVVSQTNARQRRGRAGRVAPGLAVHLGLTRHRHDKLLDDHQPPEVRRVPLEQLVLRIHATRLHEKLPGCKAAAVCALLLEPPVPQSVAKSVEQLVRLGAISVDSAGRESLTPLGGHLANLPLEARLGKLVLLGAAFGTSATEAALTVAAALQSRNPFVAPFEAREEANKARRKFADKMVSGPVGPSDHLAVLAAYNEWNKLPAWGSEKMDFCHENFLSIRTLQGMSDLKRQLLEILSQAGFVKPGLRAKQVAGAGRATDGSDGVGLALAERGERLEPVHPALLAALLCAALFPQVAMATAPVVQNSKKKKWKSEEAQQEKPKIQVRDAQTGAPVKVKLHPSSVGKEETSLTSPYFAYQELVMTGQLYIRDITPVPPLAMVLFGGNPQKDTINGEEVLTIDGWITLSVQRGLREPLLETRRRLDAIFANWVDRRGRNVQEEMERKGGMELLNVVMQLLSMQDECAPTEAPSKGGAKSQQKQDHLWQERKNKHQHKQALAQHKNKAQGQERPSKPQAFSAAFSVKRAASSSAGGEWKKHKTW